MLPSETKRWAYFGGNFPLTFVANVGQSREDIRYLSNKPGCQIGFSSEEVHFVFTGHEPDRREGVGLSLRFLGANADVQMEGRRQAEEKVHYLIGSDPSKWHTGLSTYQEIVYRELWQGIDLVFYGSHEKFKYDVVVKPGANLDDVRLAYRGAETLSLNKEGDLQIHTLYGDLAEERPVSYQVIDGRKVPVNSRFILKNGQEPCVYGFEVLEGYRPDHELVIDPALFYSTFLGGSESDSGLSIAADPFGNAYVTGVTASFDFPIAGPAFQPFKDASTTVFVSKLNPFGTAFEYSTYLGGSSADQGNGIAVDGSGHAYVTGQTLSPDFPTTPGAFRTFISGNQDAFVTKLSPDGSFLVYSTFLGGQGVDTGFGIALDGVGSAYVAGSTNSFDFPVTAGAFQPGLAGTLENAFVSKLNPNGTDLVYSTFIGGISGTDVARSIAVDFAGNAYVTGITTSADFPTSPGAFQISLTGVIAAFVTKVNEIGSGLVYSTYLTGSGDDEGRGIAVDPLGQAYVTGSTTSYDFPIAGGAFQPFYGGGLSDAFVTKVSSEGNYLVYSTFLGGDGTDSGSGIAVRSGFAFVTGSTGSFNFPITPDAIRHFTEGGDGFLTQLNIDGGSLVFSTFIGGGSPDADSAVAVDEDNNVYLTGQTFSPDFPITPGVVQPFLRGGGDAFVMKFTEFGVELLVNKFTDRFEVSPGERVIYFIEIHNPTGVLFTNVIIEDPAIGIFHFIPEIPPFSFQVFEFPFDIPLDFPLGFFRNVVRVTADQLGEPVTSEAEILVTGSPFLVATKTVNPPAGAPGETVIFTIILENHGTADLINVHIVDPLIGLDEFIGDIPIGTVITIDWPFVIPPDAQAGLTISNIVTITAANLPEPEEVGTVVEVLPVPRLEIHKTADRIFVLPGETVNFTIEVINTGNTDISNVHVTDDLTGFNITIPVLPFGQSQIFTIPFFVPLETPPLTFTNTAVAFSDQTEPVFANEEVTVLAVPRLGILKIPDTTNVVPGQTIQYTIILENIGNVPLTGIRILDPVLGIDLLVPDLEVGEVRKLTFPFTIPRESPIGSDIVNILTVESAETGPQTVESLVTVTGFGLSLLKEADRAVAIPGETVFYTLTVTNLLNEPQTNVVLNDSLLGISETIPVLQPNETITRTATFTIPADAFPGTVFLNQFTVSSDQTPLQETIAEVVVLEQPGPAIVIEKLPDRNAAAPGETITYTLTVTNLRGFPQTNVVLSDALLGLSETVASLAANETITRTVAITVPGDAVPGSIIRNTFIVSSDQTPELETIAEVVVQEPPGPALLIHKLPDRNAAAPGETVVYTLTVTNLRGFPQTNVVLTDALLGLSETVASLAANETITRTVTFTVPADAVPGSIIRNTFIVSTDQTPEQETIAEVVVQEPPGPALLIHKLPDRNAAAPGETVVYTLTVTNLRGFPQTNVVLSDALLGLSETIPLLQANETISRTVTFIVPADAVLGSAIQNTFTVSSDQTPLIETIAEVIVQAPPGPSLLIQKLPDRNSAAPGETITYTLTVTNLLGVPQTNVVLTDALLGLSETIPVLQANETITRTVTFIVPADAVLGSAILNTFTVSSDQTPLIETIAEVIVQAPPGPSLLIQKLPDRNSAAPGETVTYTLTVTNLLGVPQTNVVLTDALLGLSETIPILQANETITRTVTFVIPADAALGTVIQNTFTAVTDQTPLVEAVTEVIVQEPPGPSLLIHKVSDRNTAAPGDTITFTLTVTNLLDAVQTNVVLTDALLGLIETIPLLQANETITRTVTFTVPADAVNGSVIRNTFTAVTDQTPLLETTAEVVVQPGPVAETTLQVRKRPDRNTAAPGDIIRYTIEVTNTGPNPATNVVVIDTLTGQITIPVIAPGVTERVSVTFSVPVGTAQGEVIANRVTVRWREQPADSLPVQDEARVIVAVPAELPEVSVEAQPDQPRPGETVHKRITVTNVTDITLNNVRVFDQLLGFSTRIPQLAPGESRVFTLQLVVPAATEGGTKIRNTVSIFSDETPVQQAEVTVQTQALPDASLTETVDRSVGRPGETVIFTIQARNTGNVPLLNVLLTAPLLGIQLRIERFDVGAIETLRVPFVLPDVKKDTIIISPVTLVSDNGPTRQASASVEVIAEEEE
ncbi:putative repeat protein (TIGR01451 family) [Paenibacillus rhizosphaerae]|uniref:Putative repeat protein (TIGR01451 family) n=1 Tax=Paenibacillus rhizosphaerae TaxID=297318 RepID=A0A839TG98_9BACL|nr:SBBP repeat-containing protein [Paenibacillus rhizosphaerae]MBB3125652.1 putative repeat protein (TIGR01451 family) [Paenibacillus rhizosphaerae]